MLAPKVPQLQRHRVLAQPVRPVGSPDGDAVGGP